MRVPKKGVNQGLVEYAERLSELHAGSSDFSHRKMKGQFFTPPKVSEFMAGMFEINGDSIRLLDPGAGTGILTAAFCERVMDNSDVSELTIDAYENDSNIIPFLRAVLESCRQTLGMKGCHVDYDIIEHDFVLENASRFDHGDSLWKDDGKSSYDFVISNPPYYKLNKNSPQASAMKECVCGQPNIYTFFMALSASMLKQGGELVFITPRSFCSGLYYKKFRRWLLRSVEIKRIHIFESRKEVFDKDEVLQENIILRAKKQKKKKHGRIAITTSVNKHLEKVMKVLVSASSIIDDRNEEAFIRIPSSRADVSILEIIDGWPSTLRDLGLEISTGPVVPFRATRHLLHKFSEDGSSAPLIWMHNMQGMRLDWPGDNGKKPVAVQISVGSRPLLVPNKNYVLLRRFSSKEQKRRLHAAVLFESDLPTELVGLENHVNYIHRPGGTVSVNEACGLAAILNTGIVDKYFRSINGNTQVNATEIRSMPFPGMQEVERIGRIVCEGLTSGKMADLDNTVAEVMGIDESLFSKLNKAKEKHE